MNIEEKYKEAFREEAGELLAELEETVLALENDPEDKELVNRLFRSMHTIKGSGAMFGFEKVADFAHHLETALDHVRTGNLALTPELINLLLRSRDQIQEMLHDEQEKDDSKEIEHIIAKLGELEAHLISKNTTASIHQDSHSTQDSHSPDRSTYRLRIKLNPDIMATGLDPLCLLEELNSLGECAVSAQIDQVPLLEEMDPTICYFYWDAVITTTSKVEEIRDIFIFVENESRISITKLAHESLETDNEETHKKIGEILIERGDVSQEQVKEILSKQKRVGELMVEAGLTTQTKIDSALAEQKMLRELRSNKIQGNTIRVSTEKLDRLINLVGEMVINQAQVRQASGLYEDQDLLNPVENMERLTNELRDCALNIRMLPIETTFSKFKRLVRDLSASLHKDADLITEGGETELDKTVLERIHDPLVHLIRNSLDHGIESPDERQKDGKPAKGIIRLTAGQSGGEVVINIEDDGAGLAKEKILAKAIEKNLISESDNLTESQILDLIFHPGFSTAEKVTDVSGRGVGMDVVKREITKLRGSVEIETKRGKGTKISIHLPLTLAIIEGLLVAVEDSRYVIPLIFVQECIELTSQDVARAHNRHIIHLRGETIPYIRLREIFTFSGDQRPEIEYVVIASAEGKRIGLVVDNIIGDYQAVIKSLGRVYEHAEGVSGATILGDGTIALILDVRQLVGCAQRLEDVNIAGVATATSLI